MELCTSRRQAIAATGTVAAALVAAARPWRAFADRSNLRVAAIGKYASSFVLMADQFGLAASSEGMDLFEWTSDAAMKSGGLELTLSLDADDGDLLAKSLSTAEPDLIVDIDYRNDKRKLDPADIESRMGARVLSLDLSIVSYAEAYETVCDAMSVRPKSKKLRYLSSIDETLSKLAAIDEKDRHRVLIVDGAHGTTVYPSSSPFGLMCDLAGAEYVDCTVDEQRCEIDGREAMTDEVDIAILVNGTAYAEYANKDTFGLSWMSDRAFENPQRIFAGMVSDGFWLSNMSNFARISLGAAWLGRFLHSGQVALEAFDGVDFHKTLFGADASNTSWTIGTEYARRQPEVLGKTRVEIEEEIMAERRLQRERAESALRAAQEEASRPLSEEEAKELLDAFEESFGADLPDDALDTFMDYQNKELS